MPEISLIVCTHNRADLLPRCLEAARRQTLAVSRYEILAVDNASTDNTGPIVRRIGNEHGGPRVQYVFCREQGLSFARNAGAKAARSPILAYIDDDAIAGSTLLESMLAAYESHPDAGCVGGRIDITLPPAVPQWYTAEFAGYFSFYDPGHARLQRLSALAEYPYGANVSFRKAVLQRIGWFRTNLGRVGRNQSGGEELDAECRMAKLGYGIYYQPEARVEHIILPSRMKWEHIARTARAAGRNWAYYEREGLHPAQPLSEDLRCWYQAWKEMWSDGRWTLAHSRTIFHAGKILWKLSYRLRRV